jgi:Fe-S-cluster-containing dehydrogenase component
MDRRTFLKLTAATGAASLAGAPPAEATATHDPGEDWAVLSDLSWCGGCHECEFACAAANGLPEPQFDEATVDETLRETSELQFTVTNRFDTSAGEIYVKSQCMHCATPACAAACLTKALEKTEEGPVVWNADRCMGCRYCMISCPFDKPKFEYHSAVPRIQKCRMCLERIREGEVPACVENCPSEALTFGKRSELLEIARRRIYENPGDYVPHIYGEHEAGGTNWLYISPVPFEELGFRTDLDVVAYPEYTRDFLTSVPVVLTLWPAFLLALRQATKHDDLNGVESRGEA